MSLIKMKCERPGCKQVFMRERSEVNRARRLNRKVVCSRRCACIHGNKVSPHGTAAHLDPANRLDKWSPFRYYTKVARQRTVAWKRQIRNPRHYEMDLTPEYLKELWERQKGECYHTGWNLVLADMVSGWREGHTPKSASLDRIDTKKGYVMGNVEFVAYIYNQCKHDWGGADVLEFCLAMVDNI